MEKEEGFPLSPEKETEEKRGAVVTPDRGEVLTKEAAEERKRERKESPNWWREQP